MKASEWLTVAAIILGPILAVQAQKWIESLREKKNQRLYIFKRLMATRGAVISPAHVEALNMIDLEFSGKSNEDLAIRRRWKEYLDNLGSLSQDPELQRRQQEAWSLRNGELLADLLVDMGKAVDFDFDRVQVKRGIYAPIGHTNFELEAQAIRRGIIQLLLGQRSLPVATGPVVPSPAIKTAPANSPPSELPPSTG